MTIKEITKKDPGGVVARAAQLALRAHAGHKRESGEPYVNHAIQTAETLAGWRLDQATIAAGLLHDVVEDTPVTLEEIGRSFGEEIAFLVDGVSKLGHVKYHGPRAKVENMRKMILAIGQDLRVIFIKLADRLHNMRTLEYLPREKQKRIALETDEIYAPLAYRLGMQNLAGELHDLAFPYLYPKESEWLRRTVTERYEERARFLEKVKPTIETALTKHRIKPAVIDFRAKRWSSLYHKLLRHDMDIEKIYDLVALRIIVETVSECYNALGAIHELWPPLPGRIKDYIAMPKPNGYRSLHTTVIGPEGKYVEIQIRTREMHNEAENGIAANWIYDQKKSGGPHQKLARELSWVQQLRNWWQERPTEVSPNEFLQSMKIDFFKDRIFAITPKGDVIDLPVGATPIDFAYHIHTAVGDSCVGAKVNNRFVPLDHALRSGDVVEIMTQKNKKPSEDWLKFIKTAMARDHIRAALKRKDQALRGKRLPTKTELRIVVEDRVGLLKDITGTIARSHFNIIGLHTANTQSRYPIDKIQVATTDKSKLEKLVLKLKKIPGVKEVGYELI